MCSSHRRKKKINYYFKKENMLKNEGQNLHFPSQQLADRRRCCMKVMEDAESETLEKAAERIRKQDDDVWMHQ